MPAPEPSEPIDAATAARHLAAALDAHGQEYALGGAIALGYWAAPRGTVDVDLTLFVPPDRPSGCVQLDCNWVQEQIEHLFGRHDPRLAQWAELRKEIGV